MTTAGHLIVAGLLSYHFSLNPFPAFIGAVLPDKDLLWAKREKEGRTLWNAHRGITHHPLLVAFLFSFYVLYPDPLLLSFLAGYVSHLVMDSMTPLGLPYKSSYYPRFSLNIYRTGSVEEFFLIAGIIGGYLLLYGEAISAKDIARWWSDILVIWMKLQYW